MIFLMMDPYDPSEVEDRPRSAHVTKKEWKWLLGGMTVVAVFVYFLLQGALKNRDYHICTNNFQQMKNAIFIYMEGNNGRFPPAFVEREPGVPLMLPSAAGKHAPHTWASLIASGMERRSSLVCPAAQPNEIAENIHPTIPDIVLPSSYGLYMARAGFPSSLIQNPDRAILITETANAGAQRSFNPKPLEGGFDGIVVGWDDGNLEPTDTSKFVTRLAFYGTASGNFTGSVMGRHDVGLNVLFASGRKGRIQPTHAHLERLGSEIVGYWSEN